MRKWVKGLLFTGLGILIAGVVALFIAFAINGFNFKRTVLPMYTSGNRTLRTVEENIDDDFSNLLVDAASYDVKIEKSEDGICHIAYKDVNKEEPTFRIYIEDDTLKVMELSIDVDFDWRQTGQFLDQLGDLIEYGKTPEDADIVIRLPEKDYDTVEIKTGSGDIESVQPISCFVANFSTASGDIDLENIKGKNSLNIASASGDLDVKNAEGFEMMNLASASGEVVVDNAVLSSEINATATSGELTLKQVSVNGRAELETTSGSISLINTSFVSGEVESTSGGVYLENAEAETLSIKTTSGDVHGRIDADINVHGSTTSGEFRAPSGTKGDWNIQTISGDVNLFTVP